MCATCNPHTTDGHNGDGGGDGDDTLNGEAGNDDLAGGAGTEAVTGMGGLNDSCFGEFGFQGCELTGAG